MLLYLSAKDTEYVRWGSVDLTPKPTQAICKYSESGGTSPRSYGAQISRLAFRVYFPDSHWPLGAAASSGVIKEYMPKRTTHKFQKYIVNDSWVCKQDSARDLVSDSCLYDWIGTWMFRRSKIEMARLSGLPR